MRDRMKGAAQAVMNLAGYILFIAVAGIVMAWFCELLADIIDRMTLLTR